MDGRPRRVTLVVLVVALAGVVVVSGVPLYSLSPSPDPATAETSVVALDEDGPYVWPYATAGPSFDRATSPINLVFSDDPETVKRLLQDRAATPWNVSGPATDAGERSVHEEDSLLWQELASADRYVYVTPGPNASGTWHRPVYQLHDGWYFGAQYHLRVYNVSTGGEEWTAIQAHSEHWDWFSLTHHVDSVEEPREAIEDGFVGTANGLDVERSYFENGDSFDADGWTTIVRLSMLLVIPVGTALGTRRTAIGTTLRSHAPTLRRLLLFLSVGGIVVGVRAAGLSAEAAGIDPGIVSKLLYVVLIVGLPVFAVATARGLPVPDAVALAAGGFAISVVLDYMLITVGVLPIGLVIHRSLASIALGVLAGGGAVLRPDAFPGELLENRFLLAGIVLWAVVVAVPLL